MNVLVEEELRGKGTGAMSIPQLVSLEDMLFKRLQKEDEVVIESASVSTQMAITTGMIHGGLRSMIHRARLDFDDVNPMQTKKYVGVTGWVKDGGKNRRLKDAEKKAAVKQAVLEHFGYTHKSDNVIDAYIIARIAVNVHRSRNLLPEIDRMPYQLEVVEAVLNKK
ncbi:hypothetical protein ACFPES_02985 [Paenibacillus sp. GCM10023248]|uniref:hypothetical protein n=1 Tax=unclassified Paenibacillus TaxID=185978 RepID=UPI0023780ABF|nr:hypothetical protein [Paenibacillus sp. MAHUQ-63]MDD9265990.1 hypothetical protein [Paenibacillus sp. MAHUQ-63]